MGDDLLGARGKFDLRSLGLLDGAPDPAFANAVRIAARVTRAPAATFSIVDYDSGEVRLRALYGVDRAAIAVGAVPAGQSLLGRLASPHEIVAVPAASRDPRTRDNPVVRALGAESVLAAPALCPAEDAVGLLTVYDRAVRIWSAEEKEALAAIAQFCTQAILLRAALQTVRIVARGTGQRSVVT